MAVTSPPPPPPDPAVVARQRLVVIAGHTGDEHMIREHLKDPAPLVRVAALGGLHRLGRCEAGDLAPAFDDPAPTVRSRAAELAAAIDGISPASLLNDSDPTVVEVACFACGEMRWPSDPPIIELARIATTHDDALCRESAAAALGAIGDPSGLDAVLAACDDRVTVRRRATLALAAFDGPRADAALQKALEDKDWQVRQAAEDLLEINR